MVILRHCCKQVMPSKKVRDDADTCVPEDRYSSRRADAVCPWNVRRQVPSFRDHSLMVLSPEEVAMACSTGEKAAAHTPRL